MIKKKRLKIGITQEKMSELCGITLRNYIRIENYEIKCNIITALKICKILDLDPFETFLKE